MSKKKISLLLVLLIVCIAGSVVTYHFYHPRYLETERFITTHMLNENGTLATYLVDTPAVSPDIAHGREALSESLGLWLEYAVQKRDKALFQQNYAILQRYFFAPEGFVYWKVDATGNTDVTTNALVDDLRLVDALLTAHELWGEEEWAQTAGVIGRAVSRYLVKEGNFVDFYDRKYHNSAHVLTLSYLDPKPLARLSRVDPDGQALYEQSVAVIQAIPNDGTFFPKFYDLAGRQYGYEASVNLIDQLLIAWHRAAQGIPSPELNAFLKNELLTRGLIYGGYDRISHQPLAEFESPAVYALAILYSLEQGDTDWALTLYPKMLRLRIQSGQYQGGYVFDHQTHIFDNVFPLLAEIRLYQAKPFALMKLWLTNRQK